MRCLTLTNDERTHDPLSTSSQTQIRSDPTISNHLNIVFTNDATRTTLLTVLYDAPSSSHPTLTAATHHISIPTTLGSMIWVAVGFFHDTRIASEVK